MKLPSMQIDLKAVPQQPGKRNENYHWGIRDILTETSEEGKEREDHERDDYEEKVESILWVFHLVQIWLNCFA